MRDVRSVLHSVRRILESAIHLTLVSVTQRGLKELDSGGEVAVEWKDSSLLIYPQQNSRLEPVYRFDTSSDGRTIPLERLG